MWRKPSAVVLALSTFFCLALASAQTQPLSETDRDDAENSEASDDASQNGPRDFLIFVGTDLWRGGHFEYGGAYWSPNGVNGDGFLVKASVSKGNYEYRGGPVAGTDFTSVYVTGRQLGAQILPGWRFIQNSFDVKVFVGPEWMRNALFPDDRSAKPRGNRFALRTTVEAWYSPDPFWMIAGHASATTNAGMIDGRIAAGIHLFDLFYAGPEFVAFTTSRYRQLRAGFHITGLRTGEIEWTGALGLVRDSDGERGVYGRVGMLARR